MIFCFCGFSISSYLIEPKRVIFFHYNFPITSSFEDTDLCLYNIFTSQPHTWIIAISFTNQVIGGGLRTIGRLQVFLWLFLPLLLITTLLCDRSAPSFCLSGCLFRLRALVSEKNSYLLSSCLRLDLWKERKPS